MALPEYLTRSNPSFPPDIQTEMTALDSDLVGVFNRKTQRFEVWIERKHRRGCYARIYTHRHPDGSFLYPNHNIVKWLREADTWGISPEASARRDIAAVDAMEEARQKEVRDTLDAVGSENLRLFGRANSTGMLGQQKDILEEMRKREPKHYRELMDSNYDPSTGQD